MQAGESVGVVETMRLPGIGAAEVAPGEGFDLDCSSGSATDLVKLAGAVDVAPLSDAPEAFDNGRFRRYGAVEVLGWHAATPSPEALVAQWLAGRKEATRRAYAADLAQFVKWVGLVYNGRDSAKAVEELLGAGHGQANAITAAWRDSMIGVGLSSSTVARRLSSLRSLVGVANLAGVIDWKLDVESPRVASYRDTRGPGLNAIVEMIDACGDDREGARDRSVLRLMLDRGLRRGEIASLSVDDYDAGRPAVFTLAKGRRERSWVTVAATTVEAVNGWLEHRGTEPGPLVCRLDRRAGGGLLPMSGQGLRELVLRCGERVGLNGVQPHMVRHVAITAVLDLNGGDVRAAAAFARHASTTTTLRYDDNRADLGGEMADLLGASTAD